MSPAPGEPDTGPASDAVARAMARALALGESVRGTTSPNPPVGAVILDAAGRPVGEGATQPPGGPHAEVMALRQAGDRARGGTAVVTLEPCAHHGRTPPCAGALVRAGIAAVRFAVADPHPLGAGGGEVLRSSGVDVAEGLLADQVSGGPLRAWLHVTRTGRPHVTWKYAASLDGRVAAADRTSRWISGPRSRAEVHAMRAAADAIVVGTGTVRADDPWLTVRTPEGELASRRPLRVVVGTGEIGDAARVLDDAAPTLRARTHDPRQVLALLAERDVVDVLLEGGPTLAGAFVRAGAVDRIVAYVAPILLGQGPVALGPSGVSTITEAHQWRVEGVTMTGRDVRISAVPATGQGGG